MGSIDDGLMGRLLQVGQDIDAALAGKRIRAAVGLTEEFERVGAAAHPLKDVFALLKVEFAPKLSAAAKEATDDGAYDDAVALLTRVAAIEDGFGEDLRARGSAHSDLAATHFRAGDFDASIAVLRDAVLRLRRAAGDRPGEAKTHRDLALSLVQLGDVDAALQELLVAIECAAACGATSLFVLGVQTACHINAAGRLLPAYAVDQLRALVAESGIPGLLDQFEKTFPAAGESKSWIRKLRVFISYSSTDRDYALAFSERIDSPFVDLFLDRRRLYPGWEWEPPIMRSLEVADVLLLLVGSDTLQRSYVRLELEVYLGQPQEQWAAAQPSGRPVVPVLIPGCSERPDLIGRWQWLDCRQGPLEMHVPAILRKVWDSSIGFPTPEMPHLDRNRGHPISTLPEPEPPVTPPTGGIPVSPLAAAAFVNLGVIEASSRCWRSGDAGSVVIPRCPGPVRVMCVGCGNGACAAARHTADLFGTRLSEDGLTAPVGHLLYWCQYCRCPICTQCLGIRVSLPCPATELPSFRLRCPACAQLVQAVAFLRPDVDEFAERIAAWARAGGPPIENPGSPIGGWRS